MSLFKLFKQQVTRELRLQLRQLRFCMNTCLFFLMIVVFFPLTLPANNALLKEMAAGIVWIAMLLALFLSSERIFQQDYDEGVLEQWLASGFPLTLLTYAKLVVHWLINLIPMLIFCPILAVLFNLPLHAMWVMVFSLICGYTSILALCALAAAFSTSMKQKGVLTALVLLPLTIPVMIFGSAAIQVSLQNFPVMGYLSLLLSLSIFSLMGIPFAIAGVLRITMVC